MAQAAQSNVTPLSTAASAQGNTSSHLNLSTPAGWAFLYFFLSVAILSVLFFTV